jgi:predicted GIY-YIG superfamily endonuclease
MTAVLLNNRKIPKPSTKVNKCTYPHCTTCRLAYRSNIITTHNNEHVGLLPFKCNQRNIIYAINCAKCNIWYVGYTTRTLKERLSIHKSSIKRKDNTALAKHFMLPQHATHAHLRIAILDKSEDITSLKMKEAIWIDKLNLITKGINERDEAAAHIHDNTNIAAGHFKHSPTCFPHFTNIVSKITYNPLLLYKRKMLQGST